MKFVDGLFSLLADGINYLGDMIAQVIQFLAKPLSYLYYFFDGVFYFFYQIFNVVVKIIMIFGAMIQFFASIVAGFVRTITNMLTIDYDAVPVSYPSSSQQGMQAVIDNVLQPMGLLTVVPMIVLALIWFAFAYKVIGLIGGTKNNA